uniref:WD repeat-containing protein on Y chromosome n=1 Tax=Megaselia scalaris TaxID=36166 RepID=T1GRI5_MEGSC
MLQSYGDLTRHFAYESRLAYYYNRDSRELVVAGRIVVAIKCCAKLRLDLTDGNTHSAPVSVVLYNKLFKNIVTCGLDSYIIVWDPFTGKRQLLMKNCHTRVIYGENVDIEITAACFNTMAQFLLTGARDGSVKIWNYNNATCIRNMNIESGVK